MAWLPINLASFGSFAMQCFIVVSLDEGRALEITKSVDVTEDVSK